MEAEAEAERETTVRNWSIRPDGVVGRPDSVHVRVPFWPSASDPSWSRVVLRPPSSSSSTAPLPFCFPRFSLFRVFFLSLNVFRIERTRLISFASRSIVAYGSRSAIREIINDPFNIPPSYPLYRSSWIDNTNTRITRRSRTFHGHVTIFFSFIDDDHILAQPNPIQLNLTQLKPS